MTDEELIERYVDVPEFDKADARMRRYGIHVWALIGQLRVHDGRAQEVARDYEVPCEVVEGAMAYYRKYKDYIDARLLLNSA